MLPRTHGVPRLTTPLCLQTEPLDTSPVMSTPKLNCKGRLARRCFDMCVRNGTVICEGAAASERVANALRACCTNSTIRGNARISTRPSINGNVLCMNDLLLLSWNAAFGCRIAPAPATARPCVPEYATMLIHQEAVRGVLEFPFLEEI